LKTPLAASARTACAATEDALEARRIAEGLEKTNQTRQRTTEKMVTESLAQIGEVKEQKILFATGPDWSPGIVGLVAGRVQDQFHRPVLVMGEREDEIVGSGRSIPNFDITAALIESKEFLTKFGGHAAACGFSMPKKNLKKFLKKMTELVDQQIIEDDLIKRLFVDVEMGLDQVSWELINSLEQFEPFGEGNSRPKFLTREVEVTDIKSVGAGGKHLRLIIRQGSITRKVIAFGFAQKLGETLKPGQKADVVYEVSSNEWNGNKDMQLKLVDIQPLS